MSDGVLAGRAAGVLSTCAYISYARAILKEQELPSLSGWIIWSIVGVLLYQSYVTVGQGHQLESRWMLLASAVGPAVISGLIVIRHKRIQITFARMEKYFLFFSLASGVYLWWFQEGIVPLHVNMLIDLSGGVLIGYHAWHHPAAEDAWAWFFSTIASLLNLVAIEIWRYVNAVYPVVVSVMCLSIYLIVIVRERMLDAKSRDHPARVI
jgi:hypothetical protein